jgi:arsenite methyltransferase
MKDEKVRKVVREEYASIAKQESSCCAPTNSCCGDTVTAPDISKKIGYTDEELQAVPEGSNLGLGCGNPVALASLREGETVLDLGAGAGFDCFLAARKVGEKGKVIGVDMTAEMVEKARNNAVKSDYANVEFRLGEIENLPVADNSVDVVISNCVINLSPSKERVFKEALRVLKPGGRLMISDVVLLKDLPDIIKNNVEAYVGCISGAIKKDEYLQLIEKTGFQNVDIIDETSFPIESSTNDPATKTIIENLKISSKILKESVNSVSSIKVQGVKPK